jgi:hypothetical protein
MPTALEDNLRWKDHWDEVRTTGGGEAGRRSRSQGFEMDQDSSNDSPYRGGNYDLFKVSALGALRGVIALDHCLFPVFSYPL